MAKIELRIVDPKVFESGKAAPREQMTYGDTGSPVVIDTETAFIECEAQGKSATIKQWVVDFASHKMKLADDMPDANYHEIDYVTAVGMVGQIVSQAGVTALQKLLATLCTAYVSSGGDQPTHQSSDGGPSDSTSGDVPAEKMPELPTPINLDEI